jgi:RNA polymerase sigma-70 factor (ECF subfamily)
MTLRDATNRDLETVARALHVDVTKRARGAMRGHADADDIAQESWARATAVIAKGGAISNIRSYLYRISRNLITDHHRRETMRAEECLSPELAAELVDPRPNAEAQLVTRDELRRMDAIIAAMPARARQVFCLARIEGLSFAEIGRRTGVSRQTVHDSMTRALLAIQLAADADFEPGG